MKCILRWEVITDLEGIYKFKRGVPGDHRLRRTEERDVDRD